MFEMTAEAIEERLAVTRIGRLCMASSAGGPYAIPMPFCWMDGAIYMRIPMTGRKGDLLAENPRVCFEIDWYTDTLDDYGSVIAEGVVEAVVDMEEKARVRAVNDGKYNQLRKGFRPGHGRVVMLEKLSMQKIVVSNLSGRQKSPSAHEVNRLNAETSSVSSVQHLPRVPNPARRDGDLKPNGRALIAAAGGGCAECNVTA